MLARGVPRLVLVHCIVALACWRADAQAVTQQRNCSLFARQRAAGNLSESRHGIAPKEEEISDLSQSSAHALVVVLAC